MLPPSGEDDFPKTAVAVQTFDGLGRRSSTARWLM